MHVSVNFAHFSTKCRNYASSFYFTFSNNTSITMLLKQVNSKHIDSSYIIV